MKIILLLLIQLVLLNPIYSQKSNPIDYNSVKQDYLILKIDTIENCFLITVKDSANNFYTIISLFSTKEYGIKIEVNKIYYFQLKKLKNPPMDAYGNYVIGGEYDFNLIIDDINVSFKGDIDTGDLVTTSDLEGLFFINGNNNKRNK
jgi:hypothetical protein